MVEKEVHWSKELAETATQLRLAEERVGQLEREGRGREIRIRELEARLVAAQKLGTVRQEEVCVDWVVYLRGGGGGGTIDLWV